MPVDEREDDGVERPVGLLEERRCLARLERPPARDVRDLGEEARAEEQERLGRFAERERPTFGLDPVLAAERRRLLQVFLATGTADRVEVADEEIAHPHPALAEPAERSFIEERKTFLRHTFRVNTIQEL